MRYHIYTYPKTDTKEKINNNIIMEQEDSTFMKTIKAWNGVLIACTSAFICFIITLVIHADMSDNASCTGAITTLTEGQSTGIKFVIFCTATMSMVGSSFIIFSYYYFVSMRTFPLKLIVMLSISDFFSSVQFYIGFDNFATKCFEPEFACALSASMSQYFEMASFCWTTVIAFNIYQVLVAKHGERVEHYEMYYHLICWGFPLFLLIIVASTGSLGDAGNWCWIKKERPIERLLGYYIPLLIMMVINGVFYVLIGRGLQSFASEQKRPIILRLRKYLIVFLLTRIPSVINRFYEIASNGETVYFFLLLQSMTSPLQGFCNALVYGANKKIKRQWEEFLRERFPFCFKANREGSIDSKQLVDVTGRNDSEGSEDNNGIQKEADSV